MVQAYNQVLIMEMDVQGLHIVVIWCRFCSALWMAGWRSVVTKNRAHRLVSSCGRSILWVSGSSSCVSCFCGCLSVICGSSDCVNCTALYRLIVMELSIHCFSGGCSTLSSCV